MPEAEGEGNMNSTDGPTKRSSALLTDSALLLSTVRWLLRCSMWLLGHSGWLLTGCHNAKWLLKNLCAVFNVSSF